MRPSIRGFPPLAILAGARVYRAGDTLMEAVGTLHNGRNSGRTGLRILVVFMGAEGADNTVPMN